MNGPAKDMRNSKKCSVFYSRDSTLGIEIANAHSIFPFNDRNRLPSLTYNSLLQRTAPYLLHWGIDPRVWFKSRTCMVSSNIRLFIPKFATSSNRLHSLLIMLPYVFPWKSLLCKLLGSHWPKILSNRNIPRDGVVCIDIPKNACGHVP